MASHIENVERCYSIIAERPGIKHSPFTKLTQSIDLEERRRCIADLIATGRITPKPVLHKIGRKGVAYWPIGGAATGGSSTSTVSDQITAAAQELESIRQTITDALAHVGAVLVTLQTAAASGDLRAAPTKQEGAQDVLAA